MPDRWAPLAAPFPAEALRWRVVEMDSVEHRALVAPELDPVAITSRLDEVLGRESWSQRFQAPSPEAIICELEIAGVCKAAVVARRTPGDDADVSEPPPWRRLPSVLVSVHPPNHRSATG